MKNLRWSKRKYISLLFWKVGFFRWAGVRNYSRYEVCVQFWGIQEPWLGSVSRPDQSDQLTKPENQQGCSHGAGDERWTGWTGANCRALRTTSAPTNKNNTCTGGTIKPFSILRVFSSHWLTIGVTWVQTFSDLHTTIWTAIPSPCLHSLLVRNFNILSLI